MQTVISRRSRARGYVLITMMASAVIVLALVGLAIDTGRLQLIKVRMQTAADAAVLGGVSELKTNGAAHVSDAAKADSAANGFTDGVNAVTVTVNMPPTTGYYTGDGTAVEVKLHQSVGTFFMALLGFHSMNVNARAVARQGPGTNCMYVLDGAVSSAFSVTNGATVQSSCGIVINSNSASALYLTGGARLTASSINVVGNYSVSGGASVSPAPVIHVPAQSDPLAYVPPPAVGSCTPELTNLSIGNGNVRTISPGTYCNGITINNGARVTLNPGTYVLKGGGLTLAGGATITGTGVTFYNTQGSGYGYRGIAISNGITVQLSAPVTGPLAGMLFFQDRSVIAGEGSSFVGGASASLNGALYFPTTSVSYNNGSGTQYTILVAKQMDFAGGTTVRSDYSSLAGGSPVKGNTTLSE